MKPQQSPEMMNSTRTAAGVHQISLQLQMKENEKKEECAKDSLNAFAADMLHNDKVACILEGRKLKEGRLVAQALDGYRHRYQQPQHRREHDLSHGQPVPPPGAAGLEKTLGGLWGEDPGSGQRLQRQRDQLRDWSLQQQQELQAARLQQRLAEELYTQSRISVDSRVLQVQEVEQASRTALAHATRDFNLAKAAEDRAMCLRAQERSDEDKHQADVLMHLQADQQLATAQSAALQAARRRSHFNLLQVDEKTRTEWEEQQQEQQEEQLRADSARWAVLLEREQSRTARKQRQELDQSNVELAQRQRQQKKALEKECHDGFADSFFSQFNTSRR